MDFVRCDAPGHGTKYHDLYDLIGCSEPKSAGSKLLGGVFGAAPPSDSDLDTDTESADDVAADLDGNDGGDGVAKLSQFEREQLRREYDKWPEGHPQDADHEVVFAELQRLQIRFYIGTQTKWTAKMVRVFADFARSIGYPLTEMDLDSVSQFLPTLIEAVSDAVRVIRPPPNRHRLELSLQRLKGRKVAFKVHCGIDFGTAGSGTFSVTLCLEWMP